MPKPQPDPSDRPDVIDGEVIGPEHAGTRFDIEPFELSDAATDRLIADLDDLDDDSTRHMRHELDRLHSSAQDELDNIAAILDVVSIWTRICDGTETADDLADVARRARNAQRICHRLWLTANRIRTT